MRIKMGDWFERVLLQLEQTSARILVEDVARRKECFVCRVKVGLDVVPVAIPSVEAVHRCRTACFSRATTQYMVPMTFPKIIMPVTVVFGFIPVTRAG